MALEQKLLDDLKAQHGAVFVVSIPENKYDAAVDVVVKRPSRAEYKRFRSMLFSDEQKSDALETLAKGCIVHPSVADFAALLNERPALSEKIGGVCAELAGGGGEADAKKL